MTNKLVNLIKTAMENGIDRPKLRLGKYKFSKAARPDILWVADQSPYGADDGQFYGKIDMTTGDFYPSYTCSLEDITEIGIVMENPGLAAKVYGQRTGTCCCCGRMLTNKESIRLMIGPICLEKYGFIPSELIDDAEDDGQIKLADI